MGWFGKSEDSKPSELKANKTEIQSSADKHPETKLPEAKKLPVKLQEIIDKADEDRNFFDSVKQGYGPDSTDTNVRYAAYAARFRTILLSAHRYVAYTSDVGESFRPIAHPNLVRAAYGVSWLYLIGDVSHEGYRAYWQNQRKLNPTLQLSEHQAKVTGLPTSYTGDVLPGKVAPLEDWRTVVVQRGIFQSIASMGLPAFTIHSVVRYSGQALKNNKNKTLRTWGPIGLGLAVVPFLPFLFDHPVETAVEYVFHKGFETVGGKEAVGNLPQTGREALLDKKPKEKEL